MAEHVGMKNLYEQVISGKFKWERWGLLGALCDYVLYYNKGDILEIGCEESSIFLSKLAEKYNRKCYHIDYSKSTIDNMKNTKGYFGKNSKVYNMTSDVFFDSVKNDGLNLCFAFIDGDHEYEVVKRDYFNTEKYMTKGGYIFLHDTDPPDDSWKVPHKCGTVHKLRELLEYDGYEMFTFNKSAFDVGLTMVRV